MVKWPDLQHTDGRVSKRDTRVAHICIKMYRISTTPGKSLGPHSPVSPAPLLRGECCWLLSPEIYLSCSKIPHKWNHTAGTIWVAFFCPTFIMCLRFTQAVACITFPWTAQQNPVPRTYHAWLPLSCCWTFTLGAFLVSNHYAKAGILIFMCLFISILLLFSAGLGCRVWALSLWCAGPALAVLWLQ